AVRFALWKWGVKCGSEVRAMRTAASVWLLVGFAICFAPALNWQFEHPGYSSPPAKAAATIDGNKITVDYYAPSMHKRKIFGELVPFGEVWATGANWATKLTTPVSIDMGEL